MPSLAIFTSKPSISSSVISVSAEAARSSTTRMRAGALAAAAVGARGAPARGSALAAGATLRRQVHHDLRAPPHPFAVGRDPAAVQFHQVLDQRQADAQAALRAVQRLVGLREQVEDVRQESRVDARALVLDRDLHLAVGVAWRSG